MSVINIFFFCYKIYRSVFDLIPIIIIILIFILITNQPAHNSQVDRPACVAWMSMVMRMKNGNGYEIEYWPIINFLKTLVKVLKDFFVLHELQDSVDLWQVYNTYQPKRSSTFGENVNKSIEMCHISHELFCETHFQ